MLMLVAKKSGQWQLAGRGKLAQHLALLLGEALGLQDQVEGVARFALLGGIHDRLDKPRPTVDRVVDVCPLELVHNLYTFVDDLHWARGLIGGGGQRPSSVGLVSRAGAGAGSVGGGFNMAVGVVAVVVVVVAGRWCSPPPCLHVDFVQ